MIQDYIISAVQWGFAFALLPTVFHEDNKPTFLSSIWTGFLLIILALTFASLALWGSTVSSLVVSGLWFTLAYQRYRINKRADKPLIEIPYWLASIGPF